MAKKFKEDKAILLEKANKLVNHKTDSVIIHEYDPVLADRDRFERDDMVEKQGYIGGFNNG